MDIALVSVLSSAAVGMAGLGAAVYGIKANRSQVREERVEGRRADAYLELLTLVEAEGQWIETYLQSHVVESSYSVGDIRPVVASQPTPAQNARARAIVFAYGSRQIQELWGVWRDSVQHIDGEYQNLAYVWANPTRQNHIDYKDLIELDKVLVPKERSCRLELSVGASMELNHGGSEMYWRQQFPGTGRLRRLAFWRK